MVPSTVSSTKPLTRSYGSGDVQTDHEVDCDSMLPLLPRLGVILSMPAGFEQFTWLGRGPEESYVDRKAGVAVGFVHWHG